MMKKYSEELYSLDATSLPKELSKLGKSNAVTHGFYLVDSVGTVEDHAWNHMDQDHRPWIHRTYTEALRVARGKDFAVSLTQLKLGPFKFSVLVTDVRVSENLCYQSYSLFNLIYVHNLTHNLDKRIHIEWYLVSHRLFKFLHPLLHWRLRRLNRVQIAEDVKIIGQRKELRQKGYTFDTDKPDYLNSNSVENGVTAPSLTKKVSLDLSSLVEGTATKLSEENVSFLVEKKGAEFQVWPTVCPHQGATLSLENKCGKKLQCQWHGFKISGVTLSSSNPTATLNFYQLELVGSRLHVSQTQRAVKPSCETLSRLAA